MLKLIFRATFIRFVDLRYDEKSKQKYVKVNFTAAFSEPVMEAMEWSDLPVGYPMGKLDGDLNASHFVLTPDGEQLRQHEIQMDASSASGFEVHRVKVGDDSFEKELRFQVVTSKPGAAAEIEAYIEVIGKGTAQLRVNYEQQTEMPLQEDKQGRLISEEQAHDTSEAADDKPAAPLAPAAVMGGTHQRRKPRADKGTVN